MNDTQTHATPRGIIPPLVTPLRTQDELDVEGLVRLIEHVLQGGVHGLFILGTTGEGPSLSYQLRRELIHRTCKQVRGRVPVLVGVSDTALAESLNVARWAAESGADAVVAAPPFYYPATQPELQHYFDRLASQSPLPVVLYNMPVMTKVMIDPDTVRRAIDHPRIVGLKDSSASMGYLHQILLLRKQRSDWRIYVGNEELLAYAVQAGADGGVTGGANVFPKLLVQFFDAAAAGDPTRSNTMHALVVRLGELYRIGSPCAYAGIKGVKCALSLSGVCNDLLALPLLGFHDSDRALAKQIMADLTREIDAATNDQIAIAPRIDT